MSEANSSLWLPVLLASAPSPKGCTPFNERKTCWKKGRKKVVEMVQPVEPEEMQAKLFSSTANKKKSLPAKCEEACCGLPPPGLAAAAIPTATATT